MTGAADRRRGMPIAVLALVLTIWGAGRAVLWESPFQIPELALPATPIFAALDEPIEGGAERATDVLLVTNPVSAGGALSIADASRYIAAGGLNGSMQNTALRGVSAISLNPNVAAGHHYIIAAAFGHDWEVPGFARGSGINRMAAANLSSTAERTGAFDESAPPFLARSFPLEVSDADIGSPSDVDRWSLDAFAFYRPGSSSLSSALGRAPVYGGSQLSANLQYRIVPQSSHDPRGFVRAYHALVQDGETEVAAGVSARPIGAIPVRAAAELRITRNPFSTEARPALYAVTELPPQSLPLGIALDTYAAAGYVGGEANTLFIDGQAGLTREVFSLEGPSQKPVRLSIGGGAWGGGQRDARRLDLGPTMRIDLSVGAVPARISVDYRERVAGDAEPVSGVAATLSTRF